MFSYPGNFQCGMMIHLVTCMTLVLAGPRVYFLFLAVDKISNLDVWSKFFDSAETVPWFTGQFSEQRDGARSVGNGSGCSVCSMFFPGSPRSIFGKIR